MFDFKPGQANFLPREIGLRPTGCAGFHGVNPVKCVSYFTGVHSYYSPPSENINFPKDLGIFLLPPPPAGGLRISKNELGRSGALRRNF